MIAALAILLTVATVVSLATARATLNSILKEEL